MGHINLYKLDEKKIQAFTQEIVKKMKQGNTIEKTVHAVGKSPETFSLILYLTHPEYQKEIGWNWVLEEFGSAKIQIAPAPKAVILIKRNNGSEYAATYGHAYFTVDKFCDRDFGFNFARRLKLKEIKTTTLTTPSTHRNKTVNTYINYSELDFDSGESFAKLKAKVDLAEDFSLYKPTIEIGSSIKFSTSDESLEQILQLIIHIEDTIQNGEEICKIPVFSKIKDNTAIQHLNERLNANIQDNNEEVNISELDIIGATEIFNHNDSEFILKFRGKEKQISSLSKEEIELFCQENGFDYSDSVLNISVISLQNGNPVVTNQIRDLIDYTDDEEKCILTKGVWYRFNTDYLNYLRDSISEIDCEYHPEYDFSDEIHSNFIDDQFYETKDLPENAGKTEQIIKQELRSMYYAERTFNILRSLHDGFQNYDRKPARAGGATVEEMDLYKDGMMCAVKIGNTSAKLCYAIDQSLTALKLYRKGNLPNIPKITTIVLWFVLERKKHIEDSNGTPDINKLDMLMLKNRLDQWKKEVRLQGLKPLIYINYREK